MTPDLNIILDNLYQFEDADARRVMHTALCNLRDAGSDFTLSDLAIYLNTAAEGRLG